MPHTIVKEYTITQISNYGNSIKERTIKSYYDKKELLANNNEVLVKTERYENGVLNGHDDYPAIRFEDGYEAYYANGLRHRGSGLPAVIFPNGHKFWYSNGTLVSVEYPNGDKIQYSNGKEIGK